MSHLLVPICQNWIGRCGKRREGKWQRREFSGEQEGNCNYGSSANVRGPSWFWSACSLRTPSSLVSPHASQAPVLNGRTCSGSGKHEAWKPAGACGWATCKRVTTFFCPPHSNPHGHIPSCFFFCWPLFRFLHARSVNVTAAVGPPGPRSRRRATPHRTTHLGGQARSLQNTHRWWRETEKSEKGMGRRYWLEISRRDYSNTVIREEMYFRLSGWLMSGRKSTLPRCCLV